MSSSTTRRIQHLASRHSCCSWTSGPQGAAFDQSAIEQRSDILVYSSQPLKVPLEVMGPITVTLYASSSVPDTDFTAKLVDVFPDGTAVNSEQWHTGYPFS